MGRRLGADDGTGHGPDQASWLSSGVPHDPRLAQFSADAAPDALLPSGRLALLADELSGPERRCPGATGDELIGLLRAWTAIESWAAEAKLGVIAELIRREDAPRNGGYHGDLPDEWSPSLRHELAAALACSTQSAETVAWLAWERQARVPGVGALLGDGTLTLPKARAIIETFKYLTDGDAARAEALILDQLAGKTFPQVLRLAEQAALTVDPELAARRREQAQRKDARVALFREVTGTAALSGRDLPPDAALAAMASVNARAEEYEKSGAFGETRLDVLRAYAYLDLLNGVTAEARIACAEAQDEAAEAAEALAWAEARAAAKADAGTGIGTPPTSDADVSCAADAAASDGGTEPVPRDCLCGGCNGICLTEDHCDASAGEGRDPGGGSDGPRPGGPSAAPGKPLEGNALPLRPPDLVVPLLTLLGRAERPGEVQGFGLLDPALARELAAAAAVSSRSEICVTVTSPEGYAIGHGCARPERTSRLATPGAPLGTSRAGFPARLNLTIPATALASLAGRSDHPGQWALTPRGSPGPPDGYGTWTLAIPGGRRFMVRLDLVPTFECDHRYETHGYQPSDRLRHLVQVRDGTCTFPSCNRHARESDFEHARPYDKGGRTCPCNAGARSRACHRVKQSPGWRVIQPRPGWHQWTTPSGRTYVQEPKRYPA